MKTRHFLQGATCALALPLAGLAVSAERVLANGLNLTSAANASVKSGGSSAGSQTSMAATAIKVQSVQASATALASQAALSKSLAAYQALQVSQASANAAAVSNVAVNLFDAAHNTINGLTAGGASSSTPGGLSPIGPLTTTSASVQVVNLSGTSNQLAFSNGGSVTLPVGTSGTDKVTVTGAGSVTTAAGSVSSTAGSLTTATGGTLAANNNGGTIALTAGSGTLKAGTATMIDSTVAGSYTLNGSTVSFAANTDTAIPAGATVSLTGSSAATVSVVGAGTLQLNGAGTMTLANAAAGGGGVITTSGGVTSFTSGAVITSQAAGSTVAFTGSGSIAFSPAASDALQVIVQPTGNTNTLPAFSTTGSELATQGYVVPTSWSGVQAFSQSTSASGAVVDTITQDSQTALLYWQTFNIGKNTTLDFDQSRGGTNVGDWVAYNRILDPSTNPSQIFGSIQASGQVYVINQNGIIFNGSSQVNAHALVASTLPINTNLVTGGLLENPDLQYLFSSVAIQAGNTTPAYDPTSDTRTYRTTATVSGQTVTETFTQANTLPNVASGSITVNPGAMLVSPGSETGVGGKIALIAPKVTNFGDLDAPDGQIILAAGQQVGFEPHPGSDPSLRGLDVAIGQADVNDTVINGGTEDLPNGPAQTTSANNQPVGLLEIPEAELTIAAPIIKQDGVIAGQTSLALNGRIDLLAMSGLAGDNESKIFDTSGGAAGGTITLGVNSVTEILPDYSSTDTQVGTALSLPSQIYVEGLSFEMQSGSTLIAPNATTTFGLGVLNEPIAAATGEISTPLAENVGANSSSGAPEASPDLLPSKGAFTLDTGADLDVSGSSDVQGSAAENVIGAQLTDAVLENSPLQRDSTLHDATVYVDVTDTGTNTDGSTWVGSPLGDFSGYAGLVEHSIGELTVAGGSVAIDTNGQVNLASNSTINVSGGSIDYAGAEVPTTYLVTAAGSVVNIAQATASQTYEGIYTGYSTTSAKWGTSQTYDSGPQDGETYEAGYVQGGNAGSLSITAPDVALSGSLYGNTTTGLKQQVSPPSAGVFTLQLSDPSDNFSGANVFIQPSSDPETQGAGAVYLSPDLFGADGFGNATINTGSGDLKVSQDSTISTEAGSTLSLIAANIDVEGVIQDPSGTVSLSALSVPPSLASDPPPYNSSIGNITLGSGSALLATGLTFDELSDGTPGTLPFRVNGGSVVLNGAVIDQLSGSVIDASGGLARSSGNTVYSGKGGSISLTGLFNASVTSPSAGSITLGGTLSAYGIGTGGKLALDTLAVDVANSNTVSAPATVDGESALTLPSNFFSQGGFSSFAVSGAVALRIENNAVVSPVLTEEVANLSPSQFGVSLVSGSQLPAYPAAPVNLSLSVPGAPFATGTSANASGENSYELVMGSGASINLPATSALSLAADLVDIAGSAYAPGGSITIQGASSSKIIGLQVGQSYTPVVSVYLEDGSSLSVSGETLTSPVQVGSTTYNTGSVLAGGSISISGNIVGDPGAQLIANGAVGTIDQSTASTVSAQQSLNLQVKTSPYISETIASNGGSISLNGIEEVQYEGLLSAKAGNSSATAGSLTLGSGITSLFFTTPPAAGYPDIYIENGAGISLGAVTLGQPLASAPVDGGAYITVGQLQGFGSLIFNGNIKFQGGSIGLSASKEIELNLSSANGSLFADGSAEAITLTAPYIAIGAPTLSIDNVSVSADAPIYNLSTSASGGTIVDTPALGLADPTDGPASLVLNATDLINVSFLTMQQFNSASFNVSAGQIQGGGILYGSNQIILNAGQVYTPTGATFTVAAFGSDNSVNGGTIEIEQPANYTGSLPLSAGGTLNIFATTIDQFGDLQAPFGTINLGSTINPATGETAELATVTGTLNGQTDLYQNVTNQNQFAPQTQSITLGAASLTSVSGASLVLPYGTIENGTEWIAPNGSDITLGGFIGKGVVLQANNIQDEAGSVINISGGGELFAYAFNPGIGGTNDILSVYKYANGAIETTSSGPVSSTSFAIVPSYDFSYAPIDLTVDSTGALPYANSSITSNVGEEIYLDGGDGLAAGSYAILPARYALLPNAYLVTPASGAAAQTSTNPDGSINMAGYVYNSLNSAQTLVPTVGEYLIESNSVVNNAAPYEVESASSFLASSAESNHVAVPRLPVDAGQVIFDAGQGLDLLGTLDGAAAPGGLGSIVDIGSSNDIYILDTATSTAAIPTGEPTGYQYLTLSADELDTFDAGSLLIGGVRSASTSDASIDTLTSNIYVQNDSAHPLEGTEIILDSSSSIVVSPGASLQQTGGVFTGGQDLTVGSASTPGSGDGSLIRLTGDAGATFTRLGVNTSATNADLVIESGTATASQTSINGVAVTLDSSSAVSIDPSTLIDNTTTGASLTLSAGAITLEVSSSASAPSNGGGLLLNSSQVQSFSTTVQNLTLASYSSINLYGTGTIGNSLTGTAAPITGLTLRSSGIFGYDTGGGSVTINAKNVTLDNPNDTALSGSAPAATAGSSLVINANTVTMGANSVAIDGYDTVQLTASGGIVAANTGALNAQGNLALTAPIVTVAAGQAYDFDALSGALTLTSTGSATVTAGLGGSLSFTGSSVSLDSEVYAPSGTITAVASTGDLTVGTDAYLAATGTMSVFGTAQAYTNGGSVNLTAANGNVLIGSSSGSSTLIDVSAPAGGGSGGGVSISAANGNVSIAANSLNGHAGTSGTAGTFSATLGGDGQDVTLSGLTTPVTEGGFAAISFDVSNSPLVTVDGAVGAALGNNGISSFTLTSEDGAISVQNTINASGATGGTINLYADAGVQLTSAAVLDVNGAALNDAGQGGSIDIETRGTNGGVLDIGSGLLELGVGSGNNLGAAGTVHLRAPLLTAAPGSGGTILATVDPDTAQGTDPVAGGIAIDSLNPGNISQAGSVVVEGYRVYQPSNATIDSTLENAVATDVSNFPTATLANQLGVNGNALYQIQPGIEIANPNGSLTLGDAVTSGYASYWDLSGVRTAAGLPGILTIRAADNLVFNGSLTDGFSPNAANSSNDLFGENDPNAPYTWYALNSGNGESWSFRLVAGAAFASSGDSAANYGQITAQAAPASGSLANGSLELGLTIPTNFSYGQTTAQTADTYAEMIRTGTGNIAISVGGGVYLMNQLSTIYTAGQLAPAIANFDSPTQNNDIDVEGDIYGQTIEPAAQYGAQYTQNGGNIAISALQNIEHVTLASGTYVPDTSWQFPTNWLYRRGAVSTPGVFDQDSEDENSFLNVFASTTWWVDFSNFFEGIGALGGGNVSLNAGDNIVNVDAVIPTNARMPFTNDTGTALVELGGGDLSVVAGGTIEGGTYYVEKGVGSISAGTISSAGDTVRTSAEDKRFGGGPLATTLFVGDSTISVAATNDVTIETPVNAFLLPQGIDNGFNNHTVFSTYGSNSGVAVSSLSGTITIQGSDYTGNGNNTSLPGSLYNAYLSNASPITINGSSEASLSKLPWALTLDASSGGNGIFDDINDYLSYFIYSPPIFKATAFEGDINYQTDQTLAASPYGTIDLLAGGAIEGAFASHTSNGVLTSTIRVLDDAPNLFPGVTNPVGFGASNPGNVLYDSLADPADNQLATINNLISESPSYSALSFSTLESQHTAGLLHDNAGPPVEIDTLNGDIEDFTLITPERTDVSSGLDLEDVSLYIQNNNTNDVSIVSANRDITLYDPDSAGLESLGAAGSAHATFGDIQVSGPGILEVLAGGTLNLGQGAPATNLLDFPGTNLGITSIGGARNPFMPLSFSGAEVFVAAGLGDTSGLSSNVNNVNYSAFENDYLNFNTAPSTETSVFLPDLAALLGVSGATDAQIWDIFSGTADASLTSSETALQTELNPISPGSSATPAQQQQYELATSEATEQKDGLATTLFYDVLRDAGRNHNNPASPGFGNYDAGYAAVAALFPDTGAYNGDINLTSREIKTTFGGDINILAPGGDINVGLNNNGTPAVDQGILTVDGGNISIFTSGSVNLGTSRIFTLHGGNVIIWASAGNIDAGAASRTVQSAPPTRVLVDNQSANVETDLAGLATGGGIGVLETVVGAPPGDVDLIAPVGTVNAGDAGIRASGNVNVAASQVLNAGNIQAGGSKTGVPSTSTPNVAASVAASNTAGSTQNASTASAGQQSTASSAIQDLPSIITVEVDGFGGGDDDSASDYTPSDRKASGATYLADHP
jgi:filamentous hemagglutinin family protein